MRRKFCSFGGVATSPIRIFSVPMKPAFVIFLFAALALSPAMQAVAQRRCATAHYDSLLQATNPSYRHGRELLEKLIREDNAAQRGGRVSGTQADTLVEIPVVVHVIHDNQSGRIGGSGNSNISDGQIRSQMDVLNEDYRRRNADRTQTPAAYAGVAADLNIRFRLASTGPNGQNSTGITRHYNRKAAFDPEDRDELADIASWPTNRYLNIWVTSISGAFIGYAQFPDGTGLAGLDPVNGLEKSDGVMVDYRNFGRGPEVDSKVYNQGRSATHEIGHWLGLLHTWGDEKCGNDYIDDTPRIFGPNEGIDLACPDFFSTCGGVRVRNMTENYMDYSPDACMNLFTKNQSERIRKVLVLSPRRRQLIESLRPQLPPSDLLVIAKVYNNPFYASQSVSKPFRLDILVKNRQDVTIDVFDRSGRQVGSQLFSQTPSNSLPVDLDGLPQGLYMVRVRTATEMQTRKVVVLP